MGAKRLATILPSHRSHRGHIVLAMLALAVSCGVLAGAANAATSITATLFANATSPVDIANAGDGRIFVVEQDGEIEVFQSDGTPLGTFLDIKDRVIAGGERGLLGLAFHPDYATNGFFYVNFTRDPDDGMSGESGEGDTRIARFSRIGAFASNSADPGSEQLVIDIPQPFANHNAGDLNFGPDGNLWIAMGDGGAGCDPADRAQDPNELLGKMLRLDVDSGSPYAIPSDNPFIGVGPPLDEIWASGLRNPFRFSFDSGTGDLWIADVGQNHYEEVNVVPASSTGTENYGWDCREGFHPASDPPSSCGTTADCTGPFTEPVHEYDHSGGRCSVSGGFVYRGSAFSSLIDGYYFLADFCSGDMYALSPGSCPGSYVVHSYGQPVGTPSSFGEDSDGELLVASLAGAVYRLSATGTPDPEPPPCGGCSPTPLLTCRQPGATKGSLLIKNDPDANKDKLIWKWLKGDATPKSAFGTPQAADYDLCIYVGTAVVEAEIPGQATCPSCWTETSKGFKYKVDTPGIQKLILKSSDEPGKAKVILKGKGSGLPADLPTVPIEDLPVTVQLVNTQAECWEATFTTPKKNENNIFKAKSD